MSCIPKQQILPPAQIQKALDNLARKLHIKNELDSRWFTLDAREPYVIFDK